MNTAMAQNSSLLQQMGYFTDLIELTNEIQLTHHFLFLFTWDGGKEEFKKADF